MIYLVGGAPRVGKSILCQRIATRRSLGWISTDVVMDILRMHASDAMHVQWNVPASIPATAEWFFPSLERLVWGVSSLAAHYVIEGVDFLPAQVAALAAQYPIRAVFLGCSTMTLERFERFPGRSPGYIGLPLDKRRAIVQHVPMHSDLVRREAEAFGYPYVDMVGDFPARLEEAEARLTPHANPAANDASG
jgi:hypothetical protein